MQEWPSPTNVKDLRSFLYLATFFRRIVQGSSVLGAPSTGLLRKEMLSWCNTTCQQAVLKVKDPLTHAPALASEQPYEIYCDASGIGIDALLAFSALLLQDGRCRAF